MAKKDPNKPKVSRPTIIRKARNSKPATKFVLKNLKKK